jgi:hypothetical protein
MRAVDFRRDNCHFVAKQHQGIFRMAAFKDVEFNERLSAAANAKKALLEKFKAKPGPGDPAFEQRQAERVAAAEARKVAHERRLKEKQEAREAALRAEQAAREAEQAAREAEAKAQAEAEAKRQAEAKAERDARYAARKARKK